MKAFSSVDDVTLTSQLMTSYNEINIASEKVVNYRVTFASNHSFQISILVPERPGISVIIIFFFLRRHIRCLNY